MNTTTEMLLVAAVALLGGCDKTVCGPGTVSFFNDQTGEVVCRTQPNDAGILCDEQAGARIVGGVCTVNPSSFCGQGTSFNADAGQCVSEGGGGVVPKACDADQQGGFCVNGVIRSLRDEAFVTTKTLEVRAYDPIAFLFPPEGQPPTPEKVTVTSDGGYALNGLRGNPSLQIVALAVVDPNGVEYVLAGSGLNNVAPGGRYRLDLYAVEKTLVDEWNADAQLAGGETFQARGAYLARFRDGETATAGVQLAAAGEVVPGQFFFKDNLTTIDRALTATDGATGTLVVRVSSAPTQYTGMGGGKTWEQALGATAPGVVFIQIFRPAP